MAASKNGRGRALNANWYDYPHYYDIAVQNYTRSEADYIEALCRKHCRFQVRRLLEPACGSGRFILELASRGYETVGFDLSEPALQYLRQRLKRRGLRAKIYLADMADFRVGKPVDAAFCTVSTFRHLLTDRAACDHLKCVARALRPGGIYIVGLHPYSSGTRTPYTQKWIAHRGRTEVAATLRALRIDRHRRLEKLRIELAVREARNKFRLRHEFYYRTYTLKQFQQLLRTSGFELCGMYDFRLGVDQTDRIIDEVPYVVFVVRPGRDE